MYPAKIALEVNQGSDMDHETNDEDVKASKITRCKTCKPAGRPDERMLLLFEKGQGA